MNFTVIDFDLKKKLGVTITQYCVLDRVKHLKKVSIKDCQDIADYLTIPKRHVCKALKQLSNKRLIKLENKI